MMTGRRMDGLIWKSNWEQEDRKREREREAGVHAGGCLYQNLY